MNLQDKAGSLLPKLELKHLAPYLAYGLFIGQPRLGVIEKYLLRGVKDLGTDIIVFIDDSRHGGYMSSYIAGVKPLLRNLSDLTKEIEVNGKMFVPFNSLSPKLRYEIEFGNISFDYKDIKVSDCEKLYEWHFDVFGLIEKGLAIDINTITN